MSGIAGVYLFDGRSADRTDLEQMAESIAHRGADGHGVWAEGPAGLCHRMLWTTPESLKERLPLTSGSGNLVLTADARLDNRDEVIADLGLSDQPRDGIGDGCLILRAYARWGERCPERLSGDFAFAIWDAKRHTLFCARDRFGVKPFYYCHQPGRMFAFASEIKGLLSLSTVPRRPNEVRIADYLAMTFEDKAITFYEGISRLPPAHSMTISQGGCRLVEYWALDPTREVRYRSDDEYGQAFREIFTESVHSRLRSAYPVGSMLSGGLDSSSIVCVARQLLADEGRGNLHTFSAVFDEVPQCDERPYIDAVLAGGGLNPHYVHADRLSPLAEIDRVLWHEDEPLSPPNLYMVLGLFDAARQQSVRVLLDGFDGDTTVSHGLVYLTELARHGRLWTLARELRGLCRHNGASARRLLWRLALRPFVPAPARGIWRTLRRGHQWDWKTPGIVNPDFARRVGLAERYRAMEEPRSNPSLRARADHLSSLNCGVFPSVLEVADKAAAAFCIEPRYPYFDRRLVEFCLALPPDQALRDGWTRAIVRRGLADSLPERVRCRGRKSNLAPSFEQHLLNFGPSQLEDIATRDASLIGQYINLAALREVCRRYAQHRRRGDAVVVWNAVLLALWLHAVEGSSRCRVTVRSEL